MPLPTLHVIAPFHGLLNESWTHCAFSMKALKFPEVVQPYGYRVIEYANAGSTSTADEHVELLTSEEYESFYPAQKPGEFHGNYAVMGTRGYPKWDLRLQTELAKRVKPRDIICHVFGRAFAHLVPLFPQCQHVETGIGYGDKPFGAYRIYESEEWKNYQLGRDEHDPACKGDRGITRLYQFVVPNYFRIDDWPLSDGAGDYVLYMGRITPDKGMPTIVEIIRENNRAAVFGSRLPLKFVFAGQGDFEECVMKPLMRDPEPYKSLLDVQFVGVVKGKDRAALCGNARVMLAPTEFFEPQNGSGIEAQLCGTPLLGVPYGAFTSTIQQGVSGWRCHTLGDWLAGIEQAKNLDRKAIRKRAVANWSFDACGRLYDQAFRTISDLWDQGWYTTESHRIP